MEDIDGDVFLSCAQCEFPIVPASSVLATAVDTDPGKVYSYELEVGDTEAWVYSATNAYDNRFDVCRVSPPPGTVRFAAGPTTKDSWFAGHGWTMAACAACGTHLGWGFHPTLPHGAKRHKMLPSDAWQLWATGDRGPGELFVYGDDAGACDGPDTPACEDGEGDDCGGGSDGEGEDTTDDSAEGPFGELAFAGIVITKLARRSVDQEHLAAFRTDLAALEAHRPLYGVHMEEIIRLLDSVPTSFAAPFYPFLQSMQVDPRTRLESGTLLALVKEMIELKYQAEDDALGEMAEVD